MGQEDRGPADRGEAKQGRGVREGAGHAGRRPNPVGTRGTTGTTGTTGTDGASSPLRGWARGAGETLAVMAAVVGFGLGWAAWEMRGAGPASPYTSSAMAEQDDSESPDEVPTSPVWLVDGYNVLNVGLLRGTDRSGWWRGASRARLLEAARAFEDPGSEVWVVFDGPDPAPQAAAPPPGAPGLRVVFADSADAWLLERIRSAGAPGSIVLVTADRRLADRARHRGAHVVSPQGFLGRCQGSGSPASV